MATSVSSPSSSVDAPAGLQWSPTIIAPRRGGGLLDLGEVWRYRELLAFLVWRDISVRYKQTVMGAAWAILQPLCTMLVLSLVFGMFARMPSDGIPYPLFVFAGLLPWLLFSNSVNSAAVSLVNQSGLVTKVYFPRVFIPAAGIGVALVDFAFGIGVFAGIMAWYGRAPGAGVLLAPVLVLLTALAALGVGLLLASVTVVYRDFRYVSVFLVQTWMYLSPVVYPVSIIPEAWRWILALNPLTGLIGGLRALLLDQPLDVATLWVAVLMTFVLLIAGLWSFRRMERRFADVA